jgi:hypothetical protein
VYRIRSLYGKVHKSTITIKLCFQRFQTRSKENIASVHETIEEAQKTVFAELMLFLVTLGMESERSAVVLGAERVNVSLELNLKSFLRPCSDKQDPLFLSDGALGTFSRKIEVAYRLGLIDLKFKQALNLVRKLRNDFAHATTVESLQDGAHASRVAALFKLMDPDDNSVAPLASSFTQAAIKIKRKLGDKTANYLGCVMTLLLKLEMARFHLKPPSIEIPAKINFKDPD